jgi:hypothetical protein
VNSKKEKGLLKNEKGGRSFLSFSYRWMGLESQAREKGRRQAKKRR